MNEWGMSDKELEDFRKSYLKNKQGIGDSGVFMFMFNGNDDHDALQCLQLGIAVMMDKPVIVMADDAAKLPKNLARIAVKIERGDFSDPEKFSAAVNKVLQTLKDEDEKA